MKRRTFLLKSGLLVLAASQTARAWAKQTEISSEELMGKGNPIFYGTDYQLRKEAHEAFQAMYHEAAKSDLDINIVSSYRSYARQKLIWNRKYNKYTGNGLSPEDAINKIIEYSTIPGTSRHHWGTDIDIVDGRFIDTPNLLSAHNYEEGAPFFELKAWLNNHAERYGFYEVYTNVEGRKGFKYEPWHFTYKSLSERYLKQYLNDNLLFHFNDRTVLGSDYFNDTFLNNYLNEHIKDINPVLLG